MGVDGRKTGVEAIPLSMSNRYDPDSLSAHLEDAAEDDDLLRSADAVDISLSPNITHDAFAVHMLTDEGKQHAVDIANLFDALLTDLSARIDGRDLAIVTTKLEEACFFAKKGMARRFSA